MNLRRPYPCRRSRGAGFTLIELMIAVSIIAILAAVAYPSYADYVRRGKRATAQAALMDVASRQQAYLLDRRTYTSDLSALSFVVPAEIASDYAFTVPGFDATAVPPQFTVQATPSAALQAYGEQTLTVNQAGTKTPAATSGYWGQ